VEIQLHAFLTSEYLVLKTQNNIVVIGLTMPWMDKIVLLRYTEVYPKVSGLSRNEINKNKIKHSLRSNTKGYGGKTD